MITVPLCDSKVASSILQPPHWSAVSSITDNCPLCSVLEGRGGGGGGGGFITFPTLDLMSDLVDYLLSVPVASSFCISSIILNNYNCQKRDNKKEKGRTEELASMDGMENIKVLDFRTAFQGSVFEKYHIVPLQVASLDTTYQSQRCEDFIDLKMTPYDDGAVHQDHAKYLVDRLKQRGAGESNCHTFVKHALEFFKKYTDNLFLDFCEAQRRRMLWLEDPDEVPFELEDVLEPSEFCEGLHHFLIQNHTSELLESCFTRCGMNVRRESDNDIVRRLYGYGRRMREPIYDGERFDGDCFDGEGF
ncbi:hypothetical protein CBR_g20242 [Chara braunii]|uniref:Uncharacterized protein n=1 Tax=Chara braunii TaxID=69332 RepID=A0A388L047_CHABU|nr:hypothetical protein CBR_g20242 [Chara braunii]|eukprot:GBG75612.1 hypothetical protein CBR_g20242 [Chara braunii]